MEDFGQSPLFAIKDPRISRFPDFFVSVLEAMQCQTKAVLAFRNPLDVIDSLIARKEFWSIQRDRTDAALLWLSHLLEAERGARRLPHAIISYETLMEDPVGSMKRLVTKLGIAVPISVEEAAEVWMAAEYETDEAAAEEISQLLYHLQVLMIAKGMTLADVYKHL